MVCSATLGNISPPASTGDDCRIVQKVEHLPDIDYKRHPAYGGAYGNPGLGTRMKALKIFSQTFLRVLGEMSKAKNLRNSTAAIDNISESDPGYRLKRDGVVGHTAPTEPYERFRAMVEKHFDLDIMTHNIEGERQKKFTIRRDKNPEILSVYDEILETTGVMEESRDYLGRADVACDRVKMFIQDAHTGFRSGLFNDVGVEDSPVRYMHIDSVRRPMVKQILYMNPVDDTNGPFGFIPGSHRIPMSWLDFRIRLAVDQSVILQDWDPENRKLFCGLPAFLQRKCEFGNDVPEDHPFVQELLQNEIWFRTETEGNLLNFDNYGLHRGGLIKEGRRVVIHSEIKA